MTNALAVTINYHLRIVQAPSPVSYQIYQLIVKHFKAKEGLDAVGPVKAVSAVRTNGAILLPRTQGSLVKLVWLSLER